MSCTAFQTLVAQVNDILCTINLLNWDSRTVMPSGGVAARSHQIATLTSMARDLSTGDDMRRAIDGARRELSEVPASDIRHRALNQARAEIQTLSRIPARIISDMAMLKTRANAAWVSARATNDFSGYAPLLNQMMAMQREISTAIGGGSHPYDPLIGMYEPDMTYTGLQTIYSQLKTALVPLIERAKSAPQPRTDFLKRSFPIADQRKFGLKMAVKMGYDLTHGRLDDTTHPFEISFSRDDVRITSRFRETSIAGGIFALWHEAGHGMYEQNVALDYSRTIFATDMVNLYAVGGASFGAHESQSRLWENRIGRSRRFWELHFCDLRDHFPDQLADVSETEFWRAINRVQPGFIRIEADELTYDMHIILRTEIEAALMAGDMQVSELPGVWAEKMREYLGLEVPDDTRGVLQDVHWSHGYVGSFPTYTVGNIMSSQFFRKAGKIPEITRGLQEGDYQPLKNWLVENVYRHGRSSTPKETLLRVTGDTLNAEHYIADLTEKVEMLICNQ